MVFGTCMVFDGVGFGGSSVLGAFGSAVSSSSKVRFTSSRSGLRHHNEEIGVGIMLECPAAPAVPCGELPNDSAVGEDTELEPNP